MSEHFAGPWKVRKNLPGAEYALTLDTGRVVAIFDDGTHGHRNKENAHRVAACVNAMEGIDDPEAFVKAAKEIGKRYAEVLRNKKIAALPANAPCKVCGHARSKHIYDEGACRPGFVCESDCKQYAPPI